MNDLVVHGGVDVRGRPVEVPIADGVVTTASSGRGYDARGLTVLPGLLDLQVNGAAGVDITAEPARLWEVAASLPPYGVTGFVPTVITSDPGARAEALATFRAGPPADWVGAVPLGVHLEGPMISVARKGAHPERWLRPPSVDLVRGWSREAGVLIATIAPELPGALEVVRALTDRGVLVSVGHTDATAAQAGAAASAGAVALTHLFNAMAPVSAREPGPIGLVLAGGDLVAGVIADGHHLDPVTLNAVWRALGPRRFLAVSDTTAALGLPDGPARLGDQEVVISSGTVRLADGTLAGSAAGLIDCLRVLRDTTGASLADVVATATTTPADLIGDTWRGRIRPGQRGDLTLVDEALRVVATIIGGVVAYDARGGG